MYEEEWEAGELYEDEGVEETFESLETGNCPACGQVI